jgi:hypothetical protein
MFYDTWRHMKSEVHHPSPSLAFDRARASSDVRDVLQSWKEIAAELDRGVRTVQRWERTLGLPVHRVGKRSRSPVFAFKDELRAWLRNNAQGDGKGMERVRDSISGLEIVQHMIEFFSARLPYQKEQNCERCRGPMQILDSRFQLCGSDVGWRALLPFCGACDAEILKCLQQHQSKSLVH